MLFLVGSNRIVAHFFVGKLFQSSKTLETSLNFDRLSDPIFVLNVISCNCLICVRGVKEEFSRTFFFAFWHLQFNEGTKIQLLIFQKFWHLWDSDLWIVFCTIKEKDWSKVTGSRLVLWIGTGVELVCSELFSFPVNLCSSISITSARL